jgi:hypothetical protein
MSNTTEYHDPAWLVRCAWSSHRLARLQAVVRTTIGELEALAPGDVAGKGWLRPEHTSPPPDPVHEALRACSDELRDASGMEDSQMARAAHCSLLRRCTSQQPPAWSEAFAAALDKYRHAACRALLMALSEGTRRESIGA